jgi:hypothetical protein
MYTTVSDVHALWAAIFADRIVSHEHVVEMTNRHSLTVDGAEAYGLGFWLDPHGPAVTLEGCDTGVSFRSVHDPATGLTHTVISNTTDGAWPVSRTLRQVLG